MVVTNVEEEVRNKNLLQTARDHWVPVAVAVIAIYFYHVRYNTPLGKVPGPFWASISRLWRVSVILRKRQELEMIRLHETYGPVVRNGPGEVSISDPAAFKVIYAAGSKFGKPKWYPTWNLAGKSHKFDIFADPVIERHAANKRMISNSYSMNAVVELDAVAQRPITRLTERMSEYSDKKEPMNFSEWMQWTAFDVIGEVSFSKQFGFLDAGKDIDGVLKSIEEMLWSGIVVAEIPEVYDIKNGYAALLPFIGVYNQKLGFIIEKALGFIKERREEKQPVDRRDLLSRFFQIQSEHPEKFDDLDVQILSTLNVFAGSDTTSIALRAIFYYLMTDDRVWNKLVEEIDSAIAEGRMSEQATYNEAQKLPYLQVCIKEAMRMHPSLGTQHKRVVPEDGMTVDNKYLPPGTIVGVSAWVMHRQTSIFGDDADEFRPERWLEGDKSKMERHFMTFGNGAHVCLGKNIALLEITKIVPQVVRKFNLRLAHPEDGGWKCTSHTFVGQKDFHVICERRKSRELRQDRSAVAIQKPD